MERVLDAEALAANLSSAAKRAAKRLACATESEKNAVLGTLVRKLRAHADDILDANQRDLKQAQKDGISAALRDRLTLTAERIENMAVGVEQIIELPDPVGSTGEWSRRPNGLKIGRMRIPLGVICIIYESRPNVTIDAGVLCLKSGNAPILKGGREAFHSNAILVDLMRDALQTHSLPADAVQAVATSDRQVIGALIRRDHEVDLVIPRGGEGLVRFVTQNATVPVIQHYKGVCHVYVDASASISMATEIAFNAKVQRPGVCNAMETLLLHKDVAMAVIQQLMPRYEDAGVEIRGDDTVRALWPSVVMAQEDDWDTEYLELVLSVRVVDSLEVALEHIASYGSGHTEAIVTADDSSGERFMREVNASCVLINASTRFNDGFELGLGAEIGISTSRLHAYGPMGLLELTTRKFIGYGEGQIRS